MSAWIDVHGLPLLQLGDGGLETLLVVYGVVMLLIAFVGIGHIRQQVFYRSFGDREGAAIDELRNCPSCGSRIADRSGECEYCGEPLSNGEPAAASGDGSAVESRSASD